MKFILKLNLCIGLLALVVMSGNSIASERVRQALIIGNAEYVGDSKLKNPVNDAFLIDETLRSRGFETTVVTNATKRQMQEAIQGFAQNLDGDSVGLFYFAGHGLEVNGRNYLVPVDANIKSEADIEYETVDAGRLLSVFKGANNGLNLMILDACRDNPFVGHDSRGVVPRSGLAAMRPAVGSLVLYATEPGNVASDNARGNNGLFTKSLAESIKQPGLKIEDVFKRTAISVRRESASKQTPYLEGVILGDFVFSATDASKSSSIQQIPTPVQKAAPEGRDELAVWNEAKRLNSVDGYRRYLRAFPQGTFSMVATLKLEKIAN